jgi:anti-sigma B factor antagonist
MALSVTSRLDDGFGILHLAGALTLGPSLVALREATRQLLANGSKLDGLILRVADVSSVDSAGLGELTIVYTFANRQKCEIRLIGVSESLRKMLEMTRLDELLRTADNLEAAKRELRPK